ncbi:hypothetical protein [Demequina soli]|uniref:hypothetical protein n=1 Tax=Demequina soli TaxID=1638987 RepID=UPI0007819374|nr:hypothetical protein [Demequina soli]
MTDAAPASPAAAPARPGMTRRRAVHAAAWTAPAILVATATPAAAASGETGGTLPPGTLALAGVAAAINANDFVLEGTVAYGGPSTGTSGAAVTGVTLEFAIPTARVTGATPAISQGAGWAYSGKATSGANTVFTFAWQLDGLSATNSAANPLTVAVPKTNDLSAASVTATARGTSTGSAVLPATVTVASAALAANSATFANGSAIRFQEWYSSNPKVDAWMFDVSQAWTGPYWPVGPAITDLVVEFRIPRVESDGTVMADQPKKTLASGIGAGWVADLVGVLVGEFWVVKYHYTGPLDSDHRSTTNLKFAVKSDVAKATRVDYMLTAKSGGVNLVSAGSQAR